MNSAFICQNVKYTSIRWSHIVTSWVIFISHDLTFLLHTGSISLLQLTMKCYFMDCSKSITRILFMNSIILKVASLMAQLCVCDRLITLYREQSLALSRFVTDRNP